MAFLCHFQQLRQFTRGYPHFSWKPPIFEGETSATPQAWKGTGHHLRDQNFRSSQDCREQRSYDLKFWATEIPARQVMGRGTVRDAYEPMKNYTSWFLLGTMISHRDSYLVFHEMGQGYLFVAQRHFSRVRKRHLGEIGRKFHKLKRTIHVFLPSS